MERGINDNVSPSDPIRSIVDDKITPQEVFEYHRRGRPGKIEVTATKPLDTQRDLSLAYSPGVAEAVIEVERNPQSAYEYTAKANLVAVVSNGTAILGLGDRGALASKPVMEGKGRVVQEVRRCGCVRH